MVKLSLVIPAYNEERRIRKTLEDYYSYLSERLDKDFEILVIVNGCKDNTLDVVKAFSDNHKEIKYKNIKEAIGKGGAVIEGFKIANGDLIGFADADGATNADAYYDLVLKIGDYDGVIASRWVKGAIINKKQPFLKRLGSRVFNILVRIFFGIKISDTQCGAKLFKNYIVNNVLDKLNLTRWAFDINLLYLIKKNKFKIREVATKWNSIDESHFNLIKTVPEMFLSIVRLRLIYSPFKFIVKAYDAMPEFLKVHHRLR